MVVRGLRLAVAVGRRSMVRCFMSGVELLAQRLEAGMLALILVVNVGVRRLGSRVTEVLCSRSLPCRAAPSSRGTGSRLTSTTRPWSTAPGSNCGSFCRSSTGAASQRPGGHGGPSAVAGRPVRPSQRPARQLRRRSLPPRVLGQRAMPQGLGCGADRQPLGLAARPGGQHRRCIRPLGVAA